MLSVQFTLLLLFKPIHGHDLIFFGKGNSNKKGIVQMISNGIKFRYLVNPNSVEAIVLFKIQTSNFL